MKKPIVSWSCTGTYRGQVKERGEVRDGPGGERLARIDVSHFRGVPSIDHIFVKEAARRQGLASALVRSLQARFPDVEIRWSGTTPDGQALRVSLPYREVFDADILAAYVDLATCRARLYKTEQRSSAFCVVAAPTQAQIEAYRRWCHAVANAWNALHDRVGALEQQLAEAGSGWRRILLDVDAAAQVARMQDYHEAASLGPVYEAPAR